MERNDTELYEQRTLIQVFDSEKQVLSKYLWLVFGKTSIGPTAVKEEWTQSAVWC